MKFRYAFEKILQHKRTVEDMARKEYAEAQAKVDAAENELKGLYNVIDQSRSMGGKMQTEGGAHGPALAQIDEFIRGQNIRIERQKQKIRELRGYAEEKQEILLAAAKERKTYEKLREKKLEEFKDYRKKRELKEVDDMVVTRFKPKTGDGTAGSQ